MLSQAKQQIEKLFEELSPQLSDLQRLLEDYFDSKRVAFPRFFFMADAQYLELLSKAQKQMDINEFASIVFPGAYQFLYNTPFENNEFAISPPQHRSDQIDEIQISSANMVSSIMHPDLVNKKPKIRGQSKEIMGMTSIHRELMMFHRPVPLGQPKDLAFMLQRVETEMQVTVGNLISQAVASFPKQSLDEWILDYPLQTILTTIHLILTHEINELFEDMARVYDHQQHGTDKDDHHHSQASSENHHHKEFQEDAEYMNEYGQMEHHHPQQMRQDLNALMMPGGEYFGLPNLPGLLASNRTPDTRHLVVATTSSHAIRKMSTNQNGAPLHHHQRTISLQNLNEGFLQQKHLRLSLGLHNHVGSIPLHHHQRIKSCQQIFYGDHHQAIDHNQINNNSQEDSSPVKRMQESFNNQFEQQEVEQDEEDWLQFRRDMFGSDFDMKDVNKGIGSNRDETMRVLQEKSFKGLYLRLQFWINQICKSLKTHSLDHISHNPLQRLTMQTIINFLSYMRDVVQELKVKSVHNIEDFEWQKQIRLTWQGNANDDTRGCKVDCGAWSTYQANEYIGNFAYRLPITPLTNKYFVFISAALREKSAVLFRCIPTHDYALDVFSEFSNLCTVPFKQFQCASRGVTMKSLMQFLNGAALAQTWIFFEHLDKLDHIHLQTFNKEIQMVQQQFIIAELSQDSGEAENDEQEQSHHRSKQQQNNSLRQQSSIMIHSPFSHSMRQSQANRIHSNGLQINESKRISHMDDNSEEIKNYEEVLIAGETSESNRDFLELDERFLNQDQDSKTILKQQRMAVHSQVKSHNQSTLNRNHASSTQNKVCFGVFGSISHTFGLRNEKWAAEIAVSLQSAFRVLSLTKPELAIITSMFLKCEGFKYYDMLSQLIQDCYAQLTETFLKQSEVANMKDDSFSLTVRELRRLTYACGGLLNTIMPIVEEERKQTEFQVICDIIALYFEERLYSFSSKFADIEKPNRELISEIVTSIFSTKPKLNSKTIYPSKANSIEIMMKSETFIQESLKQQVTSIIEALNQRKPICLVGNPKTGKSKALKLAAQSLQAQPFFFNPSQVGTFRELFGDNDPLTQTSQVMHIQIGPITISLFNQVVEIMEENPNSLLVINTDFQDPLVETLLPLIEYQQFNELKQGPPSQLLKRINLTLPNGIIRAVPADIKLAFETRSLENSSPRIVSALRKLNFVEKDVDIMGLVRTKTIELLSLKTEAQNIVRAFDSYMKPLIEIFSSTCSFDQRVDRSRVYIKLIRSYTIQVVRIEKECQILNIFLAALIYAYLYPLSKEMRSKLMISELFIKLLKTLKLKSDQVEKALLDPATLQFLPFTDTVAIEGNIIINSQFKQALNFSQMVQSNLLFLGEAGSYKSTLLSYIATVQKNYFSLPSSQYLNYRALRSILKKNDIYNAVVIIDDLNLSIHNKPNPEIFLALIARNKGQILHPTQIPFILKNNWKFRIIASSPQSQSQLHQSYASFHLEQPLSDTLFVQTLVQNRLSQMYPVEAIIKIEECLLSLIPQIQTKQLHLNMHTLNDNLNLLSIEQQTLPGIKQIIHCQFDSCDIDKPALYLLKSQQLINWMSTKEVNLVLQTGRDDSYIDEIKRASRKEVKEVQGCRFKDSSSFIQEVLDLLVTICQKRTLHILLVRYDKLQDKSYFDFLCTLLKMLKENRISHLNAMLSTGLAKMLDNIQIEEVLPIIKQNLRVIISCSTKEDLEEILNHTLQIHSHFTVVKEEFLALDLAKEHSKLYSSIRSWLLDYLTTHKIAQSVPYKHFEGTQKLQQLISLHSELKDQLSKSLKEQYEKYDLYVKQSQNLSKIAAQSESGNLNMNRTQHMVYQLINIQERLDFVSSQIRHIEAEIKFNLKEQATLEKTIESQTTKSEQNLSDLIKSLATFSNTEFAKLKSHSKDQNATLFIQSISAFLKVKSITEMKFDEFFKRLEHMLESKAKLPDLVIHTVENLKHSSFEKNTLLGTLFMILKQIAQDQSSQANEHKSLIEQKEKISFIQSLLQIQKQRLLSFTEEAEDLLIKEKNAKQDLIGVTGGLDKSFQQMRHEYLLRAIIRHGKDSEQSLNKIKNRIKTLEGDTLMLAISIIYLSAIPLEERSKVRRDLAEELLLKFNLETNECWSNTTDDNNCKYFKKVVSKDLKLDRDQLKALYNMNHELSSAVASEYLFYLIFAKGLPITLDSIGVHTNLICFQLLANTAPKILSTASQTCNDQLQQCLNDASQKPVIIIDLNGHQKHNDGKCYDHPLINNLATLKEATRIDMNGLMLPKVHIHSMSSQFNLDEAFLNGSTVIDASTMNKSEAWIEIKQILLKHFLPESHSRLQVVIKQISSLQAKIKDQQHHFDALYLLIDGEALKRRDQASSEEIRRCYLELRQLEEDLQQFNQAFHAMINEHPLLASYSNIFVILFLSLKEFSYYTSEVTYSWQTYQKMLDLILAKIIRDLTMNMKQQQQNQEQSNINTGNQSETEREIQHHEGDSTPKVVVASHNNNNVKRDNKEFTIDEDFFHSAIMPGIYSTIVAGLRQEYIALFNLLFSLEIAVKKGTISEKEKQFFLKHFTEIKHYYDWRLNIHKQSTIPSGFVNDPDQNMDYQRYQLLKQELLLDIYPDCKKFFETFEDKAKFSNRPQRAILARDTSNIIYQQLFKKQKQTQPILKGSKSSQSFSDFPIMQQINLGLCICPDQEWRSKLCQFVHEELSTIFDFSEELSKLHSFIKTASWNLPIALLTQNSINIVNTVCSIASYYGVGLEVLRTDNQQTIKRQRQGWYWNQEREGDMPSLQQNEDEPQSHEAAVLHHQHLEHNEKQDTIYQNYLLTIAKDTMEVEEKQQTQNQIELITKCARNGTWVLISTLKFPSYWQLACKKLQKMALKGEILNTFRIFFDLQGYSSQEIPSSFFFNECIKFYLSDRNNEDMEGFNDVWANILNDDLLNAKELLSGQVCSPGYSMKMKNVITLNRLDSGSLVESFRPQNKQSFNASQTQLEAQVKHYQSDITIMLPNEVSQNDFLHQRDLESPQRNPKHSGMQRQYHISQSFTQGSMILDQSVDGISVISLRDQDKRIEQNPSGLLSLAQSFITDKPRKEAQLNANAVKNNNFMVEQKQAQEKPQSLQTANNRPQSSSNQAEEIKTSVRASRGGTRKTSNRASQGCDTPNIMQEQPAQLPKRQQIEMVQGAKHPSKRLQPAQKH